MFRGRRQLQRRDQEAGLGFNWRVPISSAGSFLLAMFVVALISIGLAMAVRVSIGSPGRGEPEQATLAIVPDGRGGVWSERRAIEAGPFPSRWNPAADPRYAVLRREALKAATAGGPAYQPELVELQWMRSAVNDDPGFEGAALPPLPDRNEGGRVKESREVMLAARVLDESGVKSFSHASLPLEAGKAGDLVGGRFMLAHDAAGQVLDVVPIRSSQPVVLQWLSRGLVTGENLEPGWLTVEIVVGR